MKKRVCLLLVVILLTVQGPLVSAHSYDGIRLNITNAKHGETYINVMRNGLQVDSDDMQAGDIVTVTHTPEAGYAATVRGSDAKGKSVSCQTSGNVTRLTAPYELPITISVAYRKDGSYVEPDTPSVQPEPTAPIPVEPSPQAENNISKYSYAFANAQQDFGYPATYRFPLERFQLVYGEQFAKKMKAVDFGGGAYWSGNCYGIATTAAMFSRAGNVVTPSDFRNGATRPGTEINFQKLPLKG